MNVVALFKYFATVSNFNLGVVCEQLSDLDSPPWKLMIRLRLTFVFLCPYSQWSPTSHGVGSVS